MGGLFGMSEPHISLAAEEIFRLGPLVVTNSMIMMFISMIFLVVFLARTAGRAQVIPTGRGQVLGEWIIQGLLGLIEGVAGHRLGRFIFPLIATLFLFILTANWMALALLPLVGTIGINHVDSEGHVVLYPFLRPANADLNMTIAMAIIAFAAIQLIGVRMHGVGGYLKELATPWFLFPVHVISELSRILSLSARLFGNIFGGEVFLLVLFFLFPLLIPLVPVGLEIFFGLIQAILFSVLTLVYLSMAAAGHGSHDEAHEHEAHHEAVSVSARH